MNSKKKCVELPSMSISFLFSLNDLFNLIWSIKMDKRSFCVMIKNQSNKMYKKDEPDFFVDEVHSFLYIKQKIGKKVKILQVVYQITCFAC